MTQGQEVIFSVNRDGRLQFAALLERKPKEHPITALRRWALATGALGCHYQAAKILTEPVEPVEHKQRALVPADETPEEWGPTTGIVLGQDPGSSHPPGTARDGVGRQPRRLSRLWNRLAGRCWPAFRDDPHAHFDRSLWGGILSRMGRKGGSPR